MKLRTLLILQCSYAVMSLAFLLASGWSARTSGEPLSAAPVVPSIVMFMIYAGCLLLPKLERIGWYRVAMTIAIVPFGVAGVLMNILNYARHGLRDYSSFAIWFIAVGISSYGTLWNIVVAIGWFDRDNQPVTQPDGNQA
jgi:uncharacterized membrane protein